MDHQYPRLCVAGAYTYWIIDVFGYPSLSTITASIKEVAWLMALWAKSYPRKPLRSLREATAAVEIYMATTEAHFLFKCWKTGPTNRVGGDAGAAEQWSHLLLVITLPAPRSPVGIDVHQKALRSVACKVREGYEIVIKKAQCLPFSQMCNWRQLDEVFINQRPFSKCLVKLTGAQNTQLKK